MKIEKGKLYYDTKTEQLFKAPNYGGTAREGITDKIAIHCPTEDDWDYVSSKGFYLGGVYVFDYYDLYYKDFGDLKNFDIIITIEQFKQFYPPISKEEQKELIVELSNSEPYPESVTSNKTDDNVQNNNPINPTHYNQYAIQPLDYIEANGFDFCEGNVIKYVSRYKQKNGLEDLKKARVYLDKLIKRYEK